MRLCDSETDGNDYRGEARILKHLKPCIARREVELRRQGGRRGEAISGLQVCQRAAETIKSHTPFLGSLVRRGCVICDRRPRAPL